MNEIILDLARIPKGKPGLLFPKNRRGETLFVVGTDALREKARNLKTDLSSGRFESWGTDRRGVAGECYSFEWHEMPDSDKETRIKLAKELDRFSLSVRTDATQLRQAIALLEEKGYTVSK